MSRTIAFLVVISAMALECTATQAEEHLDSCQLAAAERHSPKGRLLRRRARIGHSQVDSAVIVTVDEPVRIHQAGPTVVQGASSDTPHLPARDTEVWPPAWGLFPAAGLTE